MSGYIILNNMIDLVDIPQFVKDDETIKEFFDTAEFLKLSKDEQFSYQQDLKARLDYINVMRYAKEEAKKEGREEGVKKGEKQKAITIAKNLLDVLDVETISLKTGLSVEEIEKLSNK